MIKHVPFVDLKALHVEVRDEVDASINDIIHRSCFIGGDYVERFEKEFADFLGVREAVGVANGTDALWLGLVAAGIKSGDAVITVPNTFIATVEAIARAGAHPLFVDIDLKTANMDPEKLEDFLEEKCYIDDNGFTFHIGSGRQVKAILPVHLYGQSTHLKPIMELANSYYILVFEDACQAHGARYHWDGNMRRVGSFGAASSFSFYPAKNLGAMGDGGAVVTNDPQLAKEMRVLRDHGSSEKYVHISSDGWNSRLDAIQAAVLSIKLKKLDEWNERRREAASIYREVLADLPVKLPVEADYAEHVFHLYVVRVENRDYLLNELLKRGIGVGLHYPIPLHLQEAYRHLGYNLGDFPNAELFAKTLISLPMHQALTRDQIERVGEAIREILVGVSA
jgi:dTDP-4-amino-4,6-dideoxygalactose transaminase